MKGVVCCYAVTSAFYLTLLLLVFISIATFSILINDKPYSTVSNRDVFGGSNPSTSCDSIGWYPTFLLKADGVQYRCGYDPILEYVGYLSLSSSFFVLLATAIASFLFKKASYSFGIYILGGVVSFVLLGGTVTQTISVSKGYTYCLENLTLVHSGSPQCFLRPFITNIVAQYLLCVFWWINPIIGCTYFLTVKPYKGPTQPQNSETEDDVSDEDIQNKKPLIPKPVGSPAI
ncbi:hypothetical protein EIN_418570 [Entamoeba invadens IP1]|uniref:Transmembrane protein n=2 Tax=Entamoeba invadens TaxID=33085 RepID=A0A0A1U1R2_ENTIV|nr:hypothetical protein EIN_418570 [Entamoeba invadens IP1]ELP87978.1 hypothetical protein EIN_418570 [Entamoeba invadens IP1]BAN41629.1 hypothetical protein [Entamoeba invadens]|eukprot:XP_004254749.1 hypothetical protein EIN_418570 [Entamoeba invadens IP1]